MLAVLLFTPKQTVCGLEYYLHDLITQDV